MTTLKDFAITRWCLENKTTVYLFTAIISLAGLFVYFTMPKEQFPEIFLSAFSYQALEKRCKHHKVYLAEANEEVSELEQILLKIAKII